MNGAHSDLRHRDKQTDGTNGDILHKDGEVQMRKKKNSKLSDTIDHVQDTCTTWCLPCLVSHNPLPENPTRVQRLKHAFMLPLHGNIATYLQFFVVCIQLWIILYSLTHGEAMPGGNLFSLLILFICCAVGGYFILFIKLPPLLGMLIVGVMLRNIPEVNIIGESINNKWSGALRKIALTVILTRAGLGLDLVKLKKLSWAVLRLAFLPCTSEIITVGIASHFILGFPWKWSLMLGCILGALSPAVTVPILVNLQDRQYGVDKGIPTMLLAAGGLDNVLCVTAFSVFMGIIFSTGDLAITIVKGPLGVFVGIVYGFVAGIFLWYIPAKDCANKLFYRSLLLIGFGMIAIFGSSEIQLSGAGPLGCLTTATVAGYKWRQRRKPGEQDEVSGVMALIWLIAQHFLFGLIGAAVDIRKIESSTAGLGILTLGIGLVVRSAVDFIVTLRTGFNLKERIFITLTWISKATVQAAIGGLALDKVRESENPDPASLKYATDILTLSVLAIIICAPIGATLMTIIGPKVLRKGYPDEDSIEIKNEAASTKHVEIIDMTRLSPEEGEIKEIQKYTIEDEQTKTEIKELQSSPAFEVPVHVENISLETEIRDVVNKSNIDPHLPTEERVKDTNKSCIDNNLNLEAEIKEEINKSHIDPFIQPEKEIPNMNKSHIGPQLHIEDTVEDEVFTVGKDSANSDYPELYKSSIEITLSTSSSKSDNSNINSPLTEAEKPVLLQGVDNPVFQDIDMKA